MKRIVTQSILRFVVVFVTALIAIQGFPASWKDVWQPFLQALLAAAMILGGEQVVTFGNARRATDAPGTSRTLERRG